MIPVRPFFDELQKIAEQSPYGRQLLMGEKVEKEHTGTINYVRKQPDAPLRSVTRSIAMDHLDEDPKYYTHLKEMEDKHVKKVAAHLLPRFTKAPEGAGALERAGHVLTNAMELDHTKRTLNFFTRGLAKTSLYAAEQTGEGGDPMQTSGGTVRG